MKFGLFDHIDHAGVPLADLFDARLDYVRAAEAAGFYCYHVSEHHGTPLSMVPSPGIFLSAVARATSRIRFGPLVYLLPLYSPLRLIEEIGMLDQLSRGRFELGVGRGVSPFELNFHNTDPDTARLVFMEALDAIQAGLTSDRFTFEGERFTYKDVPMEVRPYQSPHPPIWHASSNEPGSAWGGERGFHYATLGATETARRCIDAYKEALAKRGRVLVPNDAFEGGAAIGVLRHVVIAETDDEAWRLARPAYDRWYASLTKLERENTAGPKVAKSMLPDLDQAVEKGLVVVGSPATVRAAFERQTEALGNNYFILGLMFGSLPLRAALTTVQAFADEVMPAFENAPVG